MGFTQHLKLVWQLMSAHLLSFEQVDITDIFTHMKVPCAVDTLPQAMYWLISSHDTDAGIVEIGAEQTQ